MNIDVPAQDKESAEGSNTGIKRVVPLWVMLPIAFVGLSVSLYLAWGALVAGKIAGCESGELWDCNHVLDSRWSAWFGIPVSIPGALIYLSVLVCLITLLLARSPVTRSRAKNGLVFGTSAALLSGLWFSAVQLFVIHKLCQWCLTIHTMSLILFGIVCLSRFVPAHRFAQLASGALVAVAVLITGQIVGPTPKRYQVHRFDLESTEEELGSVDIEALVSGGTTPLQLDAPSEPTWLDEPPVDATDDEVRPSLTTGVGNVLTGESSQGIAEEVAPPPIALRTRLISNEDSDLNQSQLNSEPIQPVTAKELNQLPPSAKVPTNKSSAGEKSSVPHARNNRHVRAIPVSTLTPLPDDQDTDTRAESTEVVTEVEPESKPTGRYVTFGGKTLNLRMNVLNRPILGPTDAPIVFIQLFDYTCPHCREMNNYVTGARQAYGDQLAILILPVPLSHYCNAYADGTSAQHQDACELARLAICVWKLNKNAFPEYHQWLSDSSQGRTAGEARLKAEELVDAKKLQQLLQSQYLSEFLRQHAEIYNMVGRGILPKLYSDKIGIIGKTTSVNDLLRQIAAGHDIAAAANASPRR